MLALAIHNEARGEPRSGKYAVANVILNRVKHKSFPNTVRKVVTQRGQFQWYHNHKLRSRTAPTEKLVLLHVTSIRNMYRVVV